MLIVLPIGMSDLLIGDSFWYIDRFFLLLLISLMQWFLFHVRPSLGMWLVCLVSAIFVCMLVLPGVDLIVRETIRDPFFPLRPNTRMDARYLFIDQLILNTLLGSIIGSIQWSVLKKRTFFGMVDSHHYYRIRGHNRELVRVCFRIMT